MKAFERNILNGEGIIAIDNKRYLLFREYNSKLRFILSQLFGLRPEHKIPLETLNYSKKTFPLWPDYKFPLLLRKFSHYASKKKS